MKIFIKHRIGDIREDDTDEIRDFHFVNIAKPEDIHISRQILARNICLGVYANVSQINIRKLKKKIKK